MCDDESLKCVKLVSWFHARILSAAASSPGYDAACTGHRAPKTVLLTLDCLQWAAVGFNAVCTACKADDKFIEKVLAFYPNVFNPQPYRTVKDKTIVQLLDGLRQTSYDATAQFASAQEVACDWVDSGSLRLWRIVTYMRVFALSRYPSDDIMSSAIAALPGEIDLDLTRHSVGASLRCAVQVRSNNAVVLVYKTIRNQLIKHVA